MRCALVSVEERLRADILQKLRQQSSGGATPSPVDVPRDASDVDLSRQYLDDLESRSVRQDHSKVVGELLTYSLFDEDHWFSKMYQGLFSSACASQILVAIVG